MVAAASGAGREILFTLRLATDKDAAAYLKKFGDDVAKAQEKIDKSASKAAQDQTKAAKKAMDDELAYKRYVAKEEEVSAAKRMKAREVEIQAEKQRLAERERAISDAFAAEEKAAKRAATEQTKLESVAQHEMQKRGDAQKRLAGVVNESVEGITTLGRGLAAVGLIGEKDVQKLQDTLLGVVGTMDLVRGGVKIWKSMTEGIEAYRAIVLSTAAAEQVLAAAQAARGGAGIVAGVGSAAAGATGGAASAAAGGGVAATGTMAAGGVALTTMAAAAAALAIASPLIVVAWEQLANRWKTDKQVMDELGGSWQATILGINEAINPIEYAVQGMSSLGAAAGLWEKDRTAGWYQLRNSEVALNAARAKAIEIMKEQEKLEQKRKAAAQQFGEEYQNSRKVRGMQDDISDAMSSGTPEANLARNQSKSGELERQMVMLEKMKSGADDYKRMEIDKQISALAEQRFRYAIDEYNIRKQTNQEASAAAKQEIEAGYTKIEQLQEQYKQVKKGIEDKEVSFGLMDPLEQRRLLAAGEKAKAYQSATGDERERLGSGFSRSELQLLHGSGTELGGSVAKEEALRRARASGFQSTFIPEEKKKLTDIDHAVESVRMDIKDQREIVLRYEVDMQAMGNTFEAKARKLVSDVEAQMGKIFEDKIWQINREANKEQKMKNIAGNAAVGYSK